jgi:hypothetical protein
LAVPFAVPVPFGDLGSAPRAITRPGIPDYDRRVLPVNYRSSVGVLFGLVFFAYVRNYLSEAGGPQALATAAFGGAVVFADGGLLGRTKSARVAGSAGTRPR